MRPWAVAALHMQNERELRRRGRASCQAKPSQARSHHTTRRDEGCGVCAAEWTVEARIN
jgi:hypothetical protein